MKALILALSLTLVSSAVLAQSEDEPPSGNKVAKLERMQNNLGLTDEQFGRCVTFAKRAAVAKI